MAHNIPGQLSYLDSCRTWTVVAPGQLSYLDSCRTWTVVTWTVVAWTVVAWTDVGASKCMPPSVTSRLTINQKLNCTFKIVICSK